MLSVALLAGGYTYVHQHGGGPALRGVLQSLSWLHLSAALVCIYGGLLLRPVRWALLLPAENRPSARSLIAPQFIGFAAIALFGRAADLARPYLVAQRTGTPAATQVAVYSIERAEDLAAAAVLFSVTLLFMPGTTPHHQALSRAGVLASVATAGLLSVGLLLRFAGKRTAGVLAGWLRPFSPRRAAWVAARCLEFQEGLGTLRSPAQLAATFALSLVIWGAIALSYLLCTHALPGTSELAHLGLPSVVLLMATSMGASLLQIPILGWFTQVAALAAALHGLFGVPTAAASVCSALTFTINTLSVIPAGLLLARQSGLKIRGVGLDPATPQP